VQVTHELSQHLVRRHAHSTSVAFLTVESRSQMLREVRCEIQPEPQRVMLCRDDCILSANTIQDRKTTTLP
jgi:hypothetical protein